MAEAEPLGREIAIGDRLHLVLAGDVRAINPHPGNLMSLASELHRGVVDRDPPLALGTVCPDRDRAHQVVPTGSPSNSATTS